MISLQDQLLSDELWQHIQRRNRGHPLYQRGSMRQQARPGRLSGLVDAIITLFFCSPLVMVTFPFIPPMLMLTNTLHSVWLARIATSTLQHEHKRNTFDLLTMFPNGRREAVWLLTRGALHDTHAYGKLAIWRTYVHHIMPVSLCVFILLLLLNLLPGSGFRLTLQNGMFFLVALPAITALLFDYDNTQSIVTATLVGILSSMAASNENEAQAFSLTTFLCVQAVPYIVLIGCCLLTIRMFDPIFYVAHPGAWSGFLLRSIFTLLLICFGFVLVREMLIRMLWHRVECQLDA